MRQVVGDLELDRDELDAAHLPDEGCEQLRKPTGLTAPDRLQGGTLWLAGALVNEEAHRRLGLATPDVANKVAYSDEVEPVKRDLTVPTLANVVGQDSIAVAMARRLGKRARTGNIAFADVEPVAYDVPRGN
jgi:hypothetical protein